MSDDPKPLIGDLLGLAKLADSELVNKAYDDLAHGLMHEVGQGLSDIAYTGRYILGRLLALQRDRFDRWLDRIGKDVPEERRRYIPPEIAVPTLRGLAFLEEGNPLADLYVELLKKAIDSSVPESEIHPAFPKILSEISPLEAVVLYLAQKGEVIAWYQHLFKSIPIGTPTRLSLMLDRGDLRLAEGLDGLSAVNIYHLLALDLLEWRVLPGRRFPTRDEGRRGLQISEFGAAFAKTCIPENFVLPNETTSEPGSESP